MPNRTEAAKRKLRHMPPGDYSHCACSRLYPQWRSVFLDGRRRYWSAQISRPLATTGELRALRLDRVRTADQPPGMISF